jgi:hypothetical protein
MWTWIMIAALYVSGMGVLSLLGGVRAAGDAFRNWGESASQRGRSVSVSL